MHNCSKDTVLDFKVELQNIFTLLSSITVFRDSIHIGSISPSRTIHLGESLLMLARSRITVENKPDKKTFHGCDKETQ